MNTGQIILERDTSQFERILQHLVILNVQLPEMPHRPNPNPARASDNQQRIKNRVFIVEDQPLMCRSIAEAIEREPDLTVCGQAEDVSAAMAAVLSLPPDVVLTDIQLKSSSGLDLIKSLRSRLPALPIVATTMFDVQRTERLVRAAGASAFVHKGDGPDQLIAVIRGVLKLGERDENS